MDPDREHSTPALQTRVLQGRSQMEVAHEAGVDPSQLSKIERGLASPSVSTLYRIARALKMRNLSDAIEPYVSDAARRQAGDPE